MKILIICNNDGGLYGFRKELLAKLAENNELVIAVPSGKHKSYFEECGYKYIDVPVDRRGTNPIRDLSLYRKYVRIMREEKPDLVITYTIKCNIYGCIAARMRKISYAANITGVGSALQNKSLLRSAVVFMYRYALKKAKVVFFQNKENMRLMQSLKIAGKGKSVLLNGSGVNLQQYLYQEPEIKTETVFLFVGRIMREKGVDELLEVAKRCKDNGINAKFELIGRCEEDYTGKLKEAEKSGYIKYHGLQNDVIPFVKKCDCVILPSYHEGMSNALLEGAAMGRALLASDIPGCRETMIDGETGMLFKKKNVDDMYDKVLKFVQLSDNDKIIMGKKGREYMENKFDRNDVVASVVEALEIK